MLYDIKLNYSILYYVIWYEIKLNYFILYTSYTYDTSHHQIRRDQPTLHPGYAAEYVEALNELEILSDLWRFGQRNSR